MANTSFKLVDYLIDSGYTTPNDTGGSAKQYNFTWDTDYHPTNEQATPTLNLDIQPYPNQDLTYVIDYGMQNKMVTLQGHDLDDNDRGQLQAAVMNRRPKKLYLGEDWYYYVRGIEVRSIRDHTRPNLFSYTASFLCLDPCMYADYSDGTGDYSNNVTHGVVTPSSGSCTLNLAYGGSEDIGNWYIEPIIWVNDENGNAGVVQDADGRKLSFTPPDADEWVIFPYRNYHHDQFLPDIAIAYKAQSITEANAGVNGNFGYDQPLPTFTDGGSPEVSGEFIRTGGEGSDYDTGVTLADDSGRGLIKLYPRWEYGKSSVIKVTTWADANVTLQYRYRKI